MSHPVLDSLLGVGGDFTVTSMTGAEQLVTYGKILRELRSPYYVENVGGDHTRSMQIVLTLSHVVSITMFEEGNQPTEVLSIPYKSLDLKRLLNLIAAKRDLGALPFSMVPVLDVPGLLTGPLRDHAWKLSAFMHHSGYFYVEVVQNTAKSYKPDTFSKLVKQFNPETCTNKNMITFMEKHGKDLRGWMYLVAEERYLTRTAAGNAAEALARHWGRNKMLNNRIPK